MKKFSVKSKGSKTAKQALVKLNEVNDTEAALVFAGGIILSEEDIG